MLKDYHTAPISESERVLFAFIEKVNGDHANMTAADAECLRKAGWSTEAVYDAINVCGLFNFYNRWIHATGVHAMSPKEYELSGKRLARRGYALAEAPKSA